MFRLLAVAVAVVITAMPAAAQYRVEPGLWQFSQTTEGKTAQSDPRCITPAQAQDPQSLFLPRIEPGCTLIAHSLWADRVLSTLRCDKGDSVTHIAAAVHLLSPTEVALVSTMEIRAPSGNRSVQVTGFGRRVGDCPAGGRSRGRR